MYIQTGNEDFSFAVPAGYSGNAFPPMATPEEPKAAPEAEPPSPPPSDDVPEQARESIPEGEAAPTFAEKSPKRGGSLFEKLPFLSSLLPPPRKKHGEKEGLSEWIILGIVLLLLFDSKENDLLPFLLILLLWD